MFAPILYNKSVDLYEFKLIISFYFAYKNTPPSMAEQNESIFMEQSEKFSA